MEIFVVIIDDDQRMSEDSLIWSLKDRFGEDNVIFCLTPNEGLVYIENNLQKNLMVLLDINFPQNHKDGHEILPEINKLSKLIPVILWSAIDENKESFSDFINNQAFGFISKTATSKEALAIIDRAVLFLESSLDNVIEDWIINNEQDKDKPIYLTADGEKFSLNDILKEIRMQTPTGKEFAQKFNALTIDLLLRNKERLNG